MCLKMITVWLPICGNMRAPSCRCDGFRTILSLDEFVRARLCAIEPCAETSERVQQVRDESLLIAIVHFLAHGHQHRHRLPAAALRKLYEIVDHLVELRTRLRRAVPRVGLRCRNLAHCYTGREQAGNLDFDGHSPRVQAPEPEAMPQRLRAEKQRQREE